MRRLSALSFALFFTFSACPSDNLPTTEGDVSGGVSCRSDDDCAGVQVTTCKQATCDLSTRRCVIGAVADGAACSTGAPCVESQTCLAGTCGGGQKPAADCGDKQCGQDSCGNSCGTCDGDAVCTSQGRCSVPVDNCQGLTFEGCCTAAGTTKWCDEDGNVQELDCPAENAASGELGPLCGWIEDQEYYYCTFDAADSSPSASFPYLCPGEECPAEPCAGRECGHVCGQLCGTCPNADDYCTADGKCETNACGDLTFVGCCAGSYSVYCNENEVIATDCSGGSPGTCGWDTEYEWYDCGLSGEDPIGMNPQSCDAFDFPRPPEIPGPDVGPEPGPEPGPEAVAEEVVVEEVDDVNGAETVDNDVVESTDTTETDTVGAD